MSTPPRFFLSAFADEISPDLNVQIQTLKRLGVGGLDLRSVNNINVLDLSDAEVEQVGAACQEAGIKVQAIGSPVNKVTLDVLNQARENDRLLRAIRIARRLNVTRIRIFSPETPEDQHDEFMPRVMDWMAEQIRMAAGEGVVLLHENDAKFWGAYPRNAKRLFNELAGPNFKAAFDFANTVLLGFRAMDDWFPWILPFTDTLHIKDAIQSEGKVVPAGEGDGQVKSTLEWLIAQGWNGALTMEPHLAAAGTMGGFSGEQLFEVAVSALRKTLTEAGGEA